MNKHNSSLYPVMIFTSGSVNLTGLLGIPC